PVVKVFGGQTFKELASFFASEESFRGGVEVAVGDLDGDGKAEVVTGTGAGGGPVVRVFRSDGSLTAGFAAYGTDFRGGVFVAAGDLDGDGRAEIITGAGAGGAAHVRVFSGTDLAERAGFLASDAASRGGVRVSVSDATGDGDPEVIATSDSGARAFDPLTGDLKLAMDDADMFLSGVVVG
ncbi:MAG TPA: FG-GAP-like repeat-containing protein, partial [Urbifossiella sp.]|nr:FG-GAP-like repeat-containing protein [Urbifossiella sp.]